MFALIIAHPGLLRDGLSGLLSTMPEIKVVGVTADLDSALESAETSCPSIVLLVVDELDAERVAKVQALKVACPRTPIVALAENLQEAQSLEEGAVDVALTKEVLPPRLTETISKLLQSADATTQSLDYPHPSPYGQRATENQES